MNITNAKPTQPKVAQKQKLLKNIGLRALASLKTVVVINCVNFGRNIDRQWIRPLKFLMDLLSFEITLFIIKIPK
jgi:hypothetical protein